MDWKWCTVCIKTTQNRILNTYGLWQIVRNKEIDVIRCLAWISDCSWSSNVNTKLPSSLVTEGDHCLRPRCFSLLGVFIWDSLGEEETKILALIWIICTGMKQIFSYRLKKITQILLKMGISYIEPLWKNRGTLKNLPLLVLVVSFLLPPNPFWDSAGDQWSMAGHGSGFSQGPCVSLKFIFAEFFREPSLYFGLKRPK